MKQNPVVFDAFLAKKERTFLAYPLFDSHSRQEIRLFTFAPLCELCRTTPGLQKVFPPVYSMLMYTDFDLLMFLTLTSTYPIRPSMYSYL